jgi:hypothetical protein
MAMREESERREAQVQRAVGDLERRTLAKIPGDIAKLVYLCSTRDHNTGRYHHDGLSVIFGPDVADDALAKCHQNTFQALLYKSLSQIVESLQRYFDSTGQPRDRILQVWQKLQAYHVLIPAACDSLSAEFFVSNIRIALVVLDHRDQGRPSHLEPARVLPQRL